VVTEGRLFTNLPVAVVAITVDCACIPYLPTVSRISELEFVARFTEGWQQICEK